VRQSQTAATVDRWRLSRVHIVPDAKQNKVVREHGGAIKVKLRAPAVEGKANAALRSFLAEELKISERQITIERSQVAPKADSHRGVERRRGAMPFAATN